MLHDVETDDPHRQDCGEHEPRSRAEEELVAESAHVVAGIDKSEERQERLDADEHDHENGGDLGDRAHVHRVEEARPLRLGSVAGLLRVAGLLGIPLRILVSGGLLRSLRSLRSTIRRLICGLLRGLRLLRAGLLRICHG